MGILHTGAENSVSRYDFFKKLDDSMHLKDACIELASADSMTFITKRTKNTTLNIDKMKKVFGKTFYVKEEYLLSVFKQKWSKKH